VTIRKTNLELYNYVNENFTGKTFSEKSWNLINGKNGNNCYCGALTKFLDFRRGYAKFCSVKCLSNSEDVRSKKESTIQKKYGKTHFSKTDEYRKKFQQTCLTKYGVVNPGQIPDLKKSRARKKQLTFYHSVLDQIKDSVTPLFTFEDYTQLRDKELSWQCVKCNLNFTSDLLNKLPSCPICFPKGNYGGPSKVEKDLVSAIREFYQGTIIENSRKIISPKELDIYFPEHRFAIEMNGIYWHNANLLEKNYHQEKFQICEKSQITLMMITDYEWNKNRDLILKMVKHRLGLSKGKIHARKCIVKEISANQVRGFYDVNHIHGFCPASKHYGLYLADTLVAALSCSKSRFRKHEHSEIEIIRFAVGDCVIPGAFGKLFSYVCNAFPYSSFVSYADLRYGVGKVYLKAGFTEIKTTEPGYWYFVNGKLDHRLNWSKKRLVKLGFDESKTESEIMLQLKALKIYDCGHKLYRYERI